MPGLQDHKLDQPPKQGAARFGAGLSTVEQIFNCRVILAKHLPQFHWLQEGIWQSLPSWSVESTNRRYNLWRLCTSHPGSLRPSQRRVILNNQQEEFFRASRRRQIGVFTPSCSVHFLNIIHETINEQHTVNLTGDWLVCSLRFADDIDLMGAAKTNCKTWHTHWLQVPVHTAREST